MIAPYYHLFEDEIFNYYRAISEAVSILIMLYNNPFTTHVDMPAKLVGRMTRRFENVSIKEASMDVARVFDIVEETQGMMNVFAGERIYESYRLGAVGYVNPYGNYIPLASSRIWDLLVEGRLDEAKRIQSIINKIDHTIAGRGTRFTVISATPSGDRRRSGKHPLVGDTAATDEIQRTRRRGQAAAEEDSWVCSGA